MIQEKTNQMMDKATNTAQSARDSMQEVLCIQELCCSLFLSFFVFFYDWFELHSDSLWSDESRNPVPCDLVFLGLDLAVSLRAGWSADEGQSTGCC